MATTLRGKTALVTGAARRLGREVALALGAEGANLIVHHNHSSAEAKEVCSRLEELGVRAWPLQADLGNPEKCASLIDRALETAGELHFLVNNASIFPETILDNLTIEVLDECIRVNAWAPFALGRAFARQVGRGRIVNILDARGPGSDPHHAAYALSKNMLKELTRMAALAWAPTVAVNAVAPGLILPPPGKDRDYLLKIAPSLPLQRPGEPLDVAEAVLYLLSADYITGQIIYVDGGRHIRN